MRPAHTLSIQADRTVLRGPDGEASFAAGSAGVAARFRQGRPGGLEIEAAIDAVEDAIGRMGQVAVERSLACADANVRAIADAAGLGAGHPALAVEAVEALFNRMAAAAQGALPAADALPDDRGFAATLLILRELMHHLQVREIRLETGAQAATSPSPG